MPARTFRSPTTGGELTVNLREGVTPRWLAGWEEVAADATPEAASEPEAVEQPAEPEPSPDPAADESSKEI
jgi:hypothetical protein